MFATVNLFVLCIFCALTFRTEAAKINTPRVLLPWFENVYLSFKFEIIEGGCYKWSLSRDDIIDIEPIYEDSWGHCSRAAKVTVSKLCVPPGSVIILAEETKTGEVLRGDVDIDEVRSLKVMSTTWKLFLEEAPEAFEVVAYDAQGNKFSTLEGVSLKWSTQNLGDTQGDDPLVTLVRWGDTDYEAPRGVTELEAKGLRSYSALLYGQAMGKCQVTVCLDDICTDFTLNVVASVVLTPATALIAPGDTLRYRVVRARAGRLTIQDVKDTLYLLRVPDSSIAKLEDSISLVRGSELGTTTIQLLSGSTEVAAATLTVKEPHSIRVTIRPSDLIIRGESFSIHCVLMDSNGHPMMAGDETLIRLTVSGDANLDVLKSTENGTVTEAIARNAGQFFVNARLYSVAGRRISGKVEGQATAKAVDPLQVVPPELYVAWTDTVIDIELKHRGGGEETVQWSDTDELSKEGTLSLTPSGVITVRGIGMAGVKVALKKYPNIKDYGRVWSIQPEYIQVSSSGQARVGKPHYLHVALTGTNPESGELVNFHRCNCNSFSVSLLEGPEQHNVTAVTDVQPVEGACCVLSASWSRRGVSTLRVSRARVGDVVRVMVRAAPDVLWPRRAAALTGAGVPVIAQGDALTPFTSDARIAEIISRDGPLPYQYPDVQLFTFKCLKKGEARVGVISQVDEETETVEIEAVCAPLVSKVRLEPPESTGNCSGGPWLWLRPGHEAKLKVSLYDAVGRELLDERGPKVTWEVSPRHVGIEYRAVDRLFIETHPEYAPVPVPYKYYQMVIADNQAIGWSGTIKASIPDATANIQAKVVAPLKCNPSKINIPWEGETSSNIATVSGGSGRYIVETAKGVSGVIEDGSLSVTVPGAGSYELVISDMCVDGERIYVEVNIEEVLSVEISSVRAVCVDGCIPIQALIKGVSNRYLTTNREPEWKVVGDVVVKGKQLCGVREGKGRIKAAFGDVWSQEFEVLVFPPLKILPSEARIPVGAKLQLRYEGGPPSHLASLHYEVIDGVNYVEVMNQGQIYGLAIGTSKVRLTARDISNVEMTTAETHVEVVPISNLKVRAATQTLLVGSPTPLWLEASGLSPSVLCGLQPAVKVTWTVRDAATARIYTGHADDMLERSVAEGLTVRVVPLKTGVISIDVRVRNMGQLSESRSWDSTIEILGVTDIKTSVEGYPDAVSSNERLSIAVGSTIRLKSLPRCEWKTFDNNVIEVMSNGELKALQPGYGVIVAENKDERNNIYRQSVIHVEVSQPHYATVQPAGDDEVSIRLAIRNSIGRELIAPDTDISAYPPLGLHLRKSAHAALGFELLVTGLDSAGTFMTVHGKVSGVTVKDEVWIASPDQLTQRIVASGAWSICLEGTGWRAPPSVQLHEGSDTTLAILTKDVATRHVLKADRPSRMATIHQLLVDKMEFLPGDWPYSMVPLSMTASSLTGSMVLCSEQQRYAVAGIEVELPFTCYTHAPHRAQAVLDVVEGQIGCAIIPANAIVDASDIELCAEKGVYRTCTKVALLPPIQISATKVSLIEPPATFNIIGHPRALKLVKITPSPGLKLETNLMHGELSVLVKSDDLTCGMGWVTIVSKLTGQEIKVDVDKDCDMACGTLLGALFSLLKPYLSTLVTAGVIVVAYLYIQSKLSNKVQVKIPSQPIQTTLSPDVTPQLNRSTWSRSPYASNGPSGPIYGDTSILPDSSFSPNSTRVHSRFL